MSEGTYVRIDGAAPQAWPLEAIPAPDTVEELAARGSDDHHVGATAIGVRNLLEGPRRPRRNPRVRIEDEAGRSVLVPGVEHASIGNQNGTSRFVLDPDTGV